MFAPQPQGRRGPQVGDPPGLAVGPDAQVSAGVGLDPQTRIVAPTLMTPPRKGPDKAFSATVTTAGWLVVALIGAIGLFLLFSALPSLRANTANFFLSNEWNVGNQTLSFGIAGLLWTTVLSSVIAMVVAVPIALGLALLITQYAPPGRVRTWVSFVIDLLAAVPSVVYGLWGARVFAPVLRPVQHFLQAIRGWFPLFGPGVASPGTVFAASLVLAVMILPIITALTRDAFAQTPSDQIEAATALGGTQWEVIRLAVLPYGRSSAVAAAMLGLGRALGETIAVMLILSSTNAIKINWSIFAGGQTFASKIAANAGEFVSPIKTGAYIAAGLVLFVLTFAVNAASRWILARGQVKS